jgi:putative DNA primase/helicase
VYLAKGLAPIPLPLRSKNPGRDGWQYLRLTTDALDEHFPVGKAQNIGILNGKPSDNTADVDLDCAEARRIATYFLPATGWKFGRKTSPGSHWIYRTDTALDIASNKYEDTDGEVLLELRGTGGQSVWPPSTHKETGEQITWERFEEKPAEVALHDLHRAAGEMAAATIISRHWPHKGRRDDAALALTGALCRAGWDEERVGMFVHAVATAASDEQARARADKALRTAERLREGGKVKGWPVLATLLLGNGDEVISRVKQWLGITTTVNAEEPWTDPQPIPISLPAVAPFDLDLLPEALRVFVADVAERMQCPPDFPATAVMVALAGAVGKKVGIRPKRHDDWLVVPNLWGGVVGRPGILKSPSIRQPMKFLHRLEIEAKKRYEAELREYEEKLLVVAAQKKARQKAIETAARKGEDALAVARDFVIEEPKAPVMKRYLVNDSTVEKLGEILNLTPTGLTVFRDELVGLFRQLEKEGQEGARAFYLEAWDGLGTFTYDRIGRGTIYIESVTVSLFGSIQPGRLLDYLGAALKGGAGDDGLMQRLQLLVYPDVTKRFRNVDRWPDTQAKQCAWAVFQRLDALDPTTVGAEIDADDGVAFLHFTPEAQALFDEWRVGLEEKVRSGDEHPALEAHLAKYRSLVPTLALLIHLADGGQGAVGEEALCKALRWAAYLESHARRVYATATNAAGISSQALAKRLEKGELADGFTLRDVYRKHWAGLCDRQAVEQAVDLLLDLGWLREEREQTGGKPKIRYRINPALFVKTPQDPSANSADTPADPPFGTNGTAPTGRFCAHEEENGWGEV